MSGKAHAFMIFVGVLMIAGAGGLYVKVALTGPDPDAPLPQHSIEPTGTTSPANDSDRAALDLALATPSAAPTARPSATATMKAKTKSTPRPTTTSPTTKPPTTKPPTTKPPTTTTPAGTTPPPPSTPPAWQLVWSDEFAGAELDGAAWGVSTDSQVELACSSAANVSVSDGLLHLTARREQTTCGGHPAEFSTAIVTGLAAFTDGAFEIRAKSPNGPDSAAGVAPVLSLHSPTADIDIVQAPGGAGYRAVVQSLRCTTMVQPSPCGANPAQTHTYTFPAGYPGDGMHTYRLEWEPNALRWYVDGSLAYEVDRADVSWFDAALAQPAQLRLGLLIGGPAGEAGETTTLPAILDVEYVHIYRR